MWENVLVPLVSGYRGTTEVMVYTAGLIELPVVVRDLYRIKASNSRGMLVEVGEDLGLWWRDDVIDRSDEELIEELYDCELINAVRGTWEEDSLEDRLEVEMKFERVECKGYSQGDWITVIVPWTLKDKWGISSLDKFRLICDTVVKDDCTSALFGDYDETRSSVF